MYCCYRGEDKRGGGVFIVIKNDVVFVCCIDFEINCEFVVVDVEVNLFRGNMFFVSGFYWFLLIKGEYLLEFKNFLVNVE